MPRSAADATGFRLRRTTRSARIHRDSRHRCPAGPLRPQGGEFPAPLDGREALEVVALADRRQRRVADDPRRGAGDLQPVDDAAAGQRQILPGYPGNALDGLQVDGLRPLPADRGDAAGALPVGDPGQRPQPGPLVVVHDQRVHPFSVRSTTLVRRPADPAAGIAADLLPYAVGAGRGGIEHRQQHGRRGEPGHAPNHRESHRGSIPRSAKAVPTVRAPGRPSLPSDRERFLLRPDDTTRPRGRC